MKRKSYHKKWIAFLLSIVMSISMVVSAFAAAATNDNFIEENDAPFFGWELTVGSLEFFTGPGGERGEVDVDSKLKLLTFTGGFLNPDRCVFSAA